MKMIFFEVFRVPRNHLKQKTQEILARVDLGFSQWGDFQKNVEVFVDFFYVDQINFLSFTKSLQKFLRYRRFF